MKKLSLLIWLCCSPALAAIESLPTPPNIATNYTAWLAWKNDRITAFEDYCPLERSTTYYVDFTDGSDSNDGLTEGNAFKTRSKVATVANASGGDVRFRFQRDEVWPDDTDLQITADDITLDDYGSGELPLFNAFATSYSSGWGNQSGNRWDRSEANDIAWVRLAADRLGETAGTHLIRATDATACASTSNSFFWTASTLYINLGGTDPNSVTVEAVESNTSDGVEITGDGCRVENLRADGYGCHRTTTATQNQPFTDTSSGTEANLFKGCEGYFSGSHVMAHYLGSGSGGHSMWLNCVAGFPKYNSAGETVFNTYSATGGNETWFIGCSIAYGTLKSSDWSYAAEVARGVGFFGHTASSTQEMCVYYDCHIEETSHTPCTTLGNFANLVSITGVDLTEAVGFQVDCLQLDSGVQERGVFPLVEGAVIYGGKYYYRSSSTAANGHQGPGSPGKAFAINCLIDMDQTNRSISDTAGLFIDATDGSPYLWHCFINLRNCVANGASAGRFGINMANRVNTGAGGSGKSPNAYMVNTILVNDSADADAYQVGLTNQTGQLLNNCYYNFPNAAEERSFSTDTAAIEASDLSSKPEFGVAYQAFRQTGSATVSLSHDINGKRRTVATPDIGPVDFSSPGDLVNGTIGNKSLSGGLQ